MREYHTGEVAAIIGVHPNTVRLYEQWGLISKPERRQNGYRVYTQSDLARLKMIRSLRCANYSLEAILRLLRRLSSDPDADMKEALNTPGQSEDVISVCDKLLLSLSAAEENARAIITMLLEMKEQKN